jgi:hypothetical protein
MSKRERLEIESRARAALSKHMSCQAESKKLAVGADGPLHEFDIYADGVVIGGVTTGTHKTSDGKSNTGSCDRACAELLWLSLWPGRESRVHLLTDRPLADWLFKRFSRAPFSRKIDIYHYNPAFDSLAHIGGVGA